MIKRYTSPLVIILLSFSVALADGTINGVVTNAETNGPLMGANVVLQGTEMGAATGSNGDFAIVNVPSGSYTLVVSYIGYSDYTEAVVVGDGDTSLDLVLSPTELMGDMVVVSGFKTVQKVTDAPATINVISAVEIKRHPGNIGELFGRQKGVDYIRTGIVGIGISIRGFNSAFNPKILQMNDDRLSQLIATGLAYGPLGTTVKDDIERVEVILGPSAALYGPNAHNGLVNTISKDPRAYQGTTIALSGGNQSTIGARVRHAQVVSDKIAFKVSGEYGRGTELDYSDSVYWNGVAYEELGLDLDWDTMHGEAALYYTLSPGKDLIFTYAGSKNNYVSVTNAGRNMIKDWILHVGQVKYKSPRLFGQVYYTLSRTEDTYAMNQRTQNYRSLLDVGIPDAEAQERSFAEQSSPFGGTVDRGPVFKDDSDRLNAELQYNNTWDGLKVVVGGQYQLDMAGSKGTYLLDNNEHINIRQIGLYGQAEYAFAGGLKAILAGRADDHEIYGFEMIPKGGLLYSSDIGTFRVTYGKGIVTPTILNSSMSLFGGIALGNGEGFTLSDGSKIDPLVVETVNTYEMGYKGILNEKMYIDANAYYNQSENFISPLTNISGTFVGEPGVTHRGDTPIAELTDGFLFGPGDYILTYKNFGAVNTYGFDLGFNYYLNGNIKFSANYSYFDFSMDTDDMKNDGNLDGKVDENDLPLNTPTHKANFGIAYSKDRLYGNVHARWVQSYNFFSGINVASETIDGLTYGGSPVVENALVGRDWNDGPLGGYVNIDLSVGYVVNDMFTVAVNVVNLFGSEVREFVASPAIPRLINAELKVNL